MKPIDVFLNCVSNADRWLPSGVECDNIQGTKCKSEKFEVVYVIRSII